MLLPVLYFVSAVAVGPAMVICETYLASKMLGHKWHSDTMEFLSKFAGYTLTVYFAVRLIDLAVRGGVPGIFHLKITSFMFLVEITAGSIVPLVIFWKSKFKKRVQTKAQIVAQSALIVTGVVLHRANVVFTGMHESTTGTYFPSLWELLILMGLTSTGVLVYLFVVENMEVFPAAVQEAAIKNKDTA
jgi:Ni/Fe-hydrogenase subunit HybB-like protein